MSVNGYGSSGNWVLDASVYDDDVGLRAFCPLDGETGDPIIGLTLITDMPPGVLVGVVHAGGQEAVMEWCRNHPDLLTELGLPLVDDDERA